MSGLCLKALFLCNEVESIYNLILTDSGKMSNDAIEICQHFSYHWSCSVKNSEELCSNSVS